MYFIRKKSRMNCLNMKRVISQVMQMMMTVTALKFPWAHVQTAPKAVRMVVPERVAHMDFLPPVEA